MRSSNFLLLALLSPIACVLGAAATTGQASGKRVHIPLSKRQSNDYSRLGVANIPELRSQVAHARSKILAGAISLAARVEDPEDARETGFLKLNQSRGELEGRLATFLAEHEETTAALKAKRSGWSRHSRKRQAQALEEQSGGALWTGEIEVGGQGFLVVADTGSSDLWVPGPGAARFRPRTYDPSASATSQEVPGANFTITYGDGSAAAGPVVRDNVVVGGLTATSQAVGVASRLRGFDDEFLDGILGMGFDVLSNIGAPTFFSTLFAQGGVQSNLFSFYLATSGSELVLGGFDEDKTQGEVEFTPVIDASFWTTRFVPRLNGQPVLADPQIGIVDTGTTLIIATREMVAALFEDIPGAQPFIDGGIDTGLVEMPCDTRVNISLSFGTSDRTFAIDPDNLNFGAIEAGSDRCIAGITGQDLLQGATIIGDTFLKNVMSIYDVANMQVGFADLTPQALAATRSTSAFIGDMSTGGADSSSGDDSDSSSGGSSSGSSGNGSSGNGSSGNGSSGSTGSSDENEQGNTEVQGGSTSSSSPSTPSSTDAALLSHAPPMALLLVLLLTAGAITW